MSHPCGNSDRLLVQVKPGGCAFGCLVEHPVVACPVLHDRYMGGDESGRISGRRGSHRRDFSPRDGPGIYCLWLLETTGYPGRITSLLWNRIVALLPFPQFGSLSPLSEMDQILSFKETALGAYTV